MALLLFADADVPRVNSLRPPVNPVASFPPDGDILLFPNGASSSNDTQSGAQSPAKTSSTAANTTLQDNSKLSLIRYVSGEFAKAVKPMPAGKEGFLIYVGKPLNAELLDRAVATHGATVRWRAKSAAPVAADASSCSSTQMPGNAWRRPLPKLAVLFYP